MTTAENSFDKVHKKLVTARIEFMGQLARFSKEELQVKANEDAWSPLQIAHHLYIADGMALEQMRAIHRKENPLIEDPAELMPRLTNQSEPPASLDSILAGMAARREEIFEFLASLTPTDWELPYRHSTGERKLYQLVNILPIHDRQHAQQLADLKEQQRPKQ